MISTKQNHIKSDFNKTKSYQKRFQQNKIISKTISTKRNHIKNDFNKTNQENR